MLFFLKSCNYLCLSFLNLVVIYWHRLCYSLDVLQPFEITNKRRLVR